MNLLTHRATIFGVTATIPTVRRALLAGAVAALAALTGCGNGQGAPTPTPTPSASASPAPSISPSPDLSAVSVTDAQPPVVTVKAPWAIASTQVKVLREGKTGQKIGSDATVTINYVGVNGRTGEIFDSSYRTGKPATFPLNGVIPGFKKGLEGQQVGSRVLVGVTGADGYPTGREEAKIEPGDSLVFVIDILSASFDEATGEAVSPAAGLPTVTMTDGAPTLSIAPGSAAPTDLKVQPLIKGAGPAVAANSTVTVKYRSWTYGDGKLYEDAWKPQSGPLSTLIAGWQEGLVGQTAGSRVLLVVPPAKAYPDGRPSATPALAAGQTLVYVIDILDVTAQAGS